MNKKWQCPACQGNLEKRKGTGEGVRHCSACGAGWFILKTSKERSS